MSTFNSFIRRQKVSNTTASFLHKYKSLSFVNSSIINGCYPVSFSGCQAITKYLFKIFE